VLAFYVGALVLAGGILALQLVLGHHGAGGGDGDHGADHPTDQDTTFWTFVASIRFWTFALLAFGLTGTLLRLFNFAGRVESAVLATACGLVSGVVAVAVIRRLTTKAASSLASTGDVVGRVGRVIVPVDEGTTGKVRVEVKGSHVDYVAHAAEPLAAGESVVVEDCDGGEVRVSKAPRELKP
jgi:membrane protein implicated in regulation of membrane protease activity